jgi:HSP90 family molecular chaperone
MRPITKKKYLVGRKNSVTKAIHKELDKKIIKKLMELKKKNPNKRISYLYASYIVGGGK